ncbi:YSC84-related protein [Oceaniovalibus sp. ACAM 378]|jgi:lipid-binding SYLF domain-containing protein|uniref:lipid-binding SYLF domain-containing protein n=1 Tax=Oceaniovalibus sp. ACAM 378 TaxID=2599923 RepID=UPI0011D89A05|nr:YSC84-related protein [Oceaniovalibus sp. ACAM 378]TYB90975.1 twin-arginine translocation pathway signal [Oceaniovalibus sp. ACAM 378]
MKIYSRRMVLAGVASGAALTAACSNGLNSRGPATIDARVSSSLEHLYRTYPATQDLRDKAAGVLVMPLVTEAGFGIGGSYGRGALQVAGSTIDYYSATQASVGFQIGAQQYAHVLFFMTNDSLYNFRNSPGWSAGADVQYAVNDQAGNLSADTTTSLAPVIAVIFGQAGLIAGATVKGTKYSRIIP